MVYTYSAFITKRDKEAIQKQESIFNHRRVDKNTPDKPSGFVLGG